jgi:hypothetical protein
MVTSLKFECRSWGHEHPLEFDTSDWRAYPELDDNKKTIVVVEAKCPKCGEYCYREYTIADIFSMLTQIIKEKG